MEAWCLHASPLKRGAQGGYFTSVLLRQTFTPCRIDGHPIIFCLNCTVIGQTQDSSRKKISSSSRRYFLHTIQCKNVLVPFRKEPSRNTEVTHISNGSTAPHARDAVNQRSVPGRQPGWWTPLGTRIDWAPRLMSQLSLCHKLIWPETYMKIDYMYIVKRKTMAWKQKVKTE